MATKKNNRRYVVRRERHILNRFLDFFVGKVSHHNKRHYGDGLNTRAVRERIREDGNYAAE